MGRDDEFFLGQVAQLSERVTRVLGRNPRCGAWTPVKHVGELFVSSNVNQISGSLTHMSKEKVLEEKVVLARIWHYNWLSPFSLTGTNLYLAWILCCFVFFFFCVLKHL